MATRSHGLSLSCSRRVGTGAVSDREAYLLRAAVAVPVMCAAGGLYGCKGSRQRIWGPWNSPAERFHLALNLVLAVSERLSSPRLDIDYVPSVSFAGKAVGRTIPKCGGIISVVYLGLWVYPPAIPLGGVIPRVS